MSGTFKAKGGTSNADAIASAILSLGFRVSDSYCAIRMSAALPEKPSCSPNSLCVRPLSCLMH